MSIPNRPTLMELPSQAFRKNRHLFAGWDWAQRVARHLRRAFEAAKGHGSGAHADLVAIVDAGLLLVKKAATDGPEALRGLRSALQSAAQGAKDLPARREPARPGPNGRGGE